MRISCADFGEDYSPSGDQTWDLLFRKKSLRELVENLKAHGLQGEDVLARDLFDGGETVYYRVYEEDGTYVRDVW